MYACSPSIDTEGPVQTVTEFIILCTCTARGQFDHDVTTPFNQIFLGKKIVEKKRSFDWILRQLFFLTLPSHYTIINWSYMYMSINLSSSGPKHVITIEVSTTRGLNSSEKMSAVILRFEVTHSCRSWRPLCSHLFPITFQTIGRRVWHTYSQLIKHSQQCSILF